MMTLSKQLLITVFIILVGLFLGMSYFVLKNTEEFVQSQLAQNAQDTANSLGLSISTSLKGNDLPTAKRIIDAIFDSGYYQNIKMVSTNGVTLVELINKKEVYNVPDWFEKIINIASPVKEAVVLDGWNQLGKIFVQCHPGFAYEQLYKNLTEGLYWLVFITVLVSILGYLILFFLLKPLRDITRQAALMEKKQFHQMKELPWASDLRAVVVAINHLSFRLKKIFEEQEKLAKDLKDQLYHDSLTGLKNKKWLTNKLYGMRKNNEAGVGLFIILELEDFKAYNDQFGRIAGDQALIQTARLLETLLKEENDAIIVRNEVSCFVVLLLNQPLDSEASYAQKFSPFLKKYAQVVSMASENMVHAGITSFDYSEVESEIFKKANSALIQAKKHGVNCCEIYQQSEEKKEEMLKAEMHWNNLFEKTIKENHFICHFESLTLYAYPDNLYFDVFGRLQISENNRLLSREWRYVARRIKIIHEVDLMIFSQVVQKIKSEQDKKKFYFVHLSSDTFLKPSYPEQLLARLGTLGEFKENVIVELSEYDLIQNLLEIKPILEKFILMGVKLSIDYFGANMNHLGYLQELLVKYIKIDPNFTQKIETQPENQILVKTCIDIAHSIKAKAIVKNIKNAEELAVLQKLGIDGVTNSE